MPTLRQVRWNLAKSRLRVPLAWFRHWGLDPADAFLAGYPRSGTTWTRFMLYECLSNLESGFEAVNTALPEVQDKHAAPRFLPDGGRLFKTHEIYRPQYKKAVYLSRDVRDVVLSEYHYLTMKGYIAEQEFGSFMSRFLEKRVDGFGPWTAHVDSWLSAKADGRAEILILRYEDLLKEPAEHLRKVLRFYGVQPDSDRIELAVSNNSKEGMRKKEDVARQTIYKYFRKDIRFVREAKAHGWFGKLQEQELEAIEKRAESQLRQLGYQLYTR